MTIAAGLLVLVATAVSFTVSASAGLGGSLVLVPALALVLGAKEGVALAALLLAANNVVKVFAYRDVLPWRAAAGLVVCTVVGALAGARALVAAPASLVSAAVIVMFAGSLLAERAGGHQPGRIGPPGLALVSGATSGFSGTSGPLKGVAVKRLALDRRHTVGAASLMSLAGDVAKTTVFAEAALLGPRELAVGVAAVPLMIAATFTGRALNGRLSERHYDVLFWSVLGGYTLRLLAA
jgi:uncharacterized protein